MATPRDKFQQLLRKLFQFDCADLDFGIYRIMNHKRAAIERFIDKDLLHGVARELTTGALARESGLAKELSEVAEQVRENLGDEALDAEGNLPEQFHSSKLGKRYLDLHAQAAHAHSSPEVEAEVFNHLYAFFSRYYDDGDFMSLRRYSKRDRYAIPYNGEEVHLHWANSDQYYIKTGENFTDYRYKHGDWTVEFKLRQASVEQNNNKGPKRFFVPRAAEVVQDIPKKTFTIPFEYRPLTTGEETRFGKGNGDNGSDSKPKSKAKKGQDGILDDSLPALYKAATDNDALVALKHEKRKDADGNSVTLLEHHLRVYTKKNQTDYFIHKDLQGFLERELDFYLKNEVLHLDDLEAGGEFRAERWFQLLRAIKAIGRKIIAFVAQIENFQKKLFEKKKFVTEVQYCVTLDRVPEELFAEIAKSKAQREEWIDAFGIDKIENALDAPGYSVPLKSGFLKANPHLPVSTRHFDGTLIEKLLAADSSERLWTAQPRCMMHADNFQALSLLVHYLTDNVQCVYIDPPYNTGSDEFVYKDQYQHSSWCACLENRLVHAHRLLRDDGAIMVSIGEEELGVLQILLDHLFGRDNRISIITVKRASATGHKVINPGVVNVSEFVLIYAKNRDRWIGNTVYAERDRDSRYSTFVKNRSREPADWEFVSLLDAFAEHLGVQKGKLRSQLGDRYEESLTAFVYENADTVCQPVTVDLEGVGAEFREWVEKSSRAGNKVLRFRRKGFEDAYLRNGSKLIFYREKLMRVGSRLATAEKATDIWTDVLPNDLHNEGGVDLPKGKKPEALLKRLIELGSDEGDIVLDFFAGTGTTAAVAQKKMNRRWVVVEGAEFFDEKPFKRIKNVLYGETRGVSDAVGWQGGGACKIIRLESYEDALDNITFTPTAEQSELQFEEGEYLLSYMLDFETRSSDTLLNVAKLDSPFDYKLRRHGQDEPLPVDLPETFNYLIGLHVRTRRVYHNKTVRYLVYRGLADGRETAIVWRTTRGWEQKDFEADRAFVAKEKLADGAAVVYVNSDSCIEGACSLDPVFKKRMFSED